MMLLQPEAGLLFWMFLSFGIVFAVLAKFGFPIITKMVEDRNAYIEKSLDAAKEANKQLAHIKEQSEAILASAREEQVKILKDAESTRTRIINESKELARAEGLKELEELRKQMRLEKEDAIKDIRRQVADLSVDIAEKIIRNNLNSNTEQMAMIDRLIDESMVSKS
ncbi:F0F1 ATP synthase subunit B [Dysgonomonas sp. GY617]|uniref:F0F1 ATP synthase subunit B n=1 Tax=Dysgonomonas sp. GY617 TaxID=2780420 RepID=UPI0018842260|nr:F0F1 ATP synthase subunit B [Dysgonomonas sp. GY617]MBF0577039.1 F0F1 ATP synthase subunit B [Dysgonomonas sp. GY617]